MISPVKAKSTLTRAVMTLIADRTNSAELAETAVKQIEAAYEATRDGEQQQWAAFYEGQLPEAQAIRDQLESK